MHPTAKPTLKPKLKAIRWKVSREEELIEFWEEEEIYRFDKETRKPIFSIDTPPPYASGQWHVAQTAHYAQIDMIARYFRMKGYEILFPFGIDRNGLPVEVQVEKKHNIRAYGVPRERFIQTCADFLDEMEAAIVQVARRIGMTCDLTDYYRTDSPEYRRVTQASFIELWRRGLIYEDDRPTSWCPVCRTTIADAEIDYVEEETDLNYIKFGVKETRETIIIATTRPELVCACAAVLFNPEDKRHQDLEGKTATVPLYGQEVPILPHSYAKPEFGTGLVMVCSYGDYYDVRLFRELSLEPVVAINTVGRMTEKARPYQGMKVEEARQKIIEDLREKGLLVKLERMTHRKPVCWRSGDPIEFIAMPEYYLKQLDFLNDLYTIIDEIHFHPPELKQILLNWIDSVVTDWPISRRRFYGTEIPIWYCKKCGEVHLPEPGRYYQPWKEKAPFERCSCGSMQFVGEERTFDTWMDSSLSQLFIIGYLQDKDLFKKAYPCSLRPQGIDITRTWLYYSILRTLQLLKRPAFIHVRLSGMGLDEKGEAMHKSKGNVVYPDPIFQRYGADAFRLWSASEAKLGSNYRFSEKRVRGAALFITKLWNAARFISSFSRVTDGYKLATLDSLILGELNRLVDRCSLGYDQMDVYIPANAVKVFTWGVFADHYIEAVKSRAYNQEGEFDEDLQRGAWWTLQSCLETILKLLAPICPFITDAIWRELYSEESIHVQSFPRKRSEWENKLVELTPKFMDFNTLIWKYKKEKAIALSQELSTTVYAPKELEIFEGDLRAMHRIRELRFTKPTDEERTKARRLNSDVFILG